LDSARNKASLRRIISAYGHGDMGPLLEALHPDIVWISHGPPQFLRFAGKHVGRDNCLVGLSSMGADFALHNYEIVEIVAEGDIVWMQARLETSRRSGGSRHVIEVANRWQFADGKIVHLTEYYDSASMLLRDDKLKAAG
jgi:ketosteroid isomerase-like protein